MKNLLLLLLVVMTSACASNRDLSKGLSNTDKLEPSPCACDPIPYETPDFEWTVIKHG